MEEDKIITSNKKRIARNTLMLYFRQMLILVVSLYSVRVVLNTLGAIDYGIYNVVAGFVTMFSFLSSAMASATQRYFSYDLGKNRNDALRKTFNITLEIYLLIGIIVVIFAETIGIWFLYNKMVIPKNRINAAFIIYQFSIISFLIGLIAAPYMALIIAHENMSIYAYVSIVEAILKLVVVFILKVFPFDKLIIYGILLCIVTTLITLIYFIFCKIRYPESKLKCTWDKEMFLEIASFSGWSLFGTAAGVVKNQVTNVILNLFFGPVVNAARGIAYNINNAVTSFASNFSMAVRPQIIKSYSSGNTDEAIALTFESSKYTFLLMWVILLPLELEMETVFKLWLKDVPELTVIFTRLVLIEVLADSLCYSLQSITQATGKLKLYQSVVGSFILLNLPLSYVSLKLGCTAFFIQYVAIFICFISLFLRLVIIKKLINFSISNFFKQVLIPCFFVVLFSSVIPTLLHFVITRVWLRFFIVILVAVLNVIFFSYLLGLNTMERKKIKNFILRRFKK